MPPDDAELGSPEQWLAYARSDLILARREPEPGVLLETLCFHAQQAAEKALKAALTHFGIPFQKTHVLTVLIEGLPSQCPSPPHLDRVKGLSAYAVAARYPVGLGEISAEDYAEAVRLADAMVTWAESVVSGGTTT